MSKADYVRSQRQDRRHECHWPGCDKQVPPAMWGCREHWFALPGSLRNAIWNAYVPGQERRLDPSAEYLAAAREVQAWIKEHYLELGEWEDDIAGAPVQEGWRYEPTAIAPVAIAQPAAETPIVVTPNEGGSR